MSQQRTRQLYCGNEIATEKMIRKQVCDRAIGTDGLDVPFEGLVAVQVPGGTRPGTPCLSSMTSRTAAAAPLVLSLCMYYERQAEVFYSQGLRKMGDEERLPQRYDVKVHTGAFALKDPVLRRLNAEQPF